MSLVSPFSPTKTPLLHLLQDFYFVKGSLHIVRGALLDLHCHVGVILEVFAEPDSGEVTPP